MPVPYSPTPACLAKWEAVIEGYDYEADNDLGRHWVYLKTGFWSPEMGCHTLHEPRLRDIAKLLRRVEPCVCEECAAGI